MRLNKPYNGIKFTAYLGCRPSSSIPLAFLLAPVLLLEHSNLPANPGSYYLDQNTDFFHPSKSVLKNCCLPSWQASLVVTKGCSVNNCAWSTYSVPGIKHFIPSQHSLRSHWRIKYMNSRISYPPCGECQTSWYMTFGRFAKQPITEESKA